MEVKQAKRTGPPPDDISGLRSGRLQASCYLGAPSQWECVCDCGNLTSVAAGDLKRQKVRSCGCLLAELKKTGDMRRKHGMSGTPEYRSWSSMVRRCSDPNTTGFHRYGGRGIKVCDRWIDSFENFFSDMGLRLVGTSLDRKDVDGNYEPSNCRWATATEQAQNMSSNVKLTANGKTQSLSAWSRELGISTNALAYRVGRGVADEEVINRPYRAHRKW